MRRAINHASAAATAVPVSAMRRSRRSSVDSTLFVSAMLRAICAAPPRGNAVVRTRYSVPLMSTVRKRGFRRARRSPCRWASTGIAG